MAALSDLVLAAQQRCDRVNASTISTQEWYSYVNQSLQELYATLCQCNDDWNAVQYQFTLSGGDPPGNTLTIGPGTSVPNFYKPRGVWRMLTVTPSLRWAPLRRLANLIERNQYVGPTISLLYGQIPSAWNLYGNQLEILPPASSAGTYNLLYVPTLPTLVNPTDTIDQYWLTVNGWQEFVTYDVAGKALVKEESLDTAQICFAQAQQVKRRVIEEATPRDDSEPGQIGDVMRVRENFGLGGWGGGNEGWGGW